MDNVTRKEIYENEKVVVCYIEPWVFDVEEQQTILENVQKVFPSYNVLILWKDMMQIEITSIDEEIERLKHIIKSWEKIKAKNEEKYESR